MFKRGNGVYWTCIRHKGKKIQKSLETTDRKLAQAIEAKIRVELAEGKYFEKPKGDSMTVKELIDRYLEDHSKPNKKPKTYRDDISFSKKIIKHFGNMLLTEVSPKHISAFIKARREDSVSDITLGHELVLLRHAYNLAIKEWELINDSPFAKIKIPRSDSKRVRYLSNDEEIRLLNALPEWLTPIVTIARETGLRVSNICSLKWGQVNLFNKMIIIENTKNGDSLGLPMTENVLNTLISLNKVRRFNSDNIFYNKKTGKTITIGWVGRTFRKVCKQACIENFRFHDLRHDFCSRLVQRGVDLYTVAALAGHRDIKTTQRYAHLSPEKLRSAIDIFNSDYNLTTVNKNSIGTIL